MNCPKCDYELRTTDRQGVEMDYCPLCRGVWLDPGELDKIVERSLSYDARRRDGDRDDDRDDDYKYSEGLGKLRGQPRKRKGFLGDLFDFD